MPEHVLHVTAVDGGSDPVEAHATVTVELMDVNDHAPETAINIMSDSGQVEVQEEQEGGRSDGELLMFDGSQSNLCVTLVSCFYFYKMRNHLKYTIPL